MTQKGIVIQLGKPHAHRNWIWILDFFYNQTRSSSVNTFSGYSSPDQR